MAKGYIIARVTVHDQEAYALYARGAAVAQAKHGARVLARGGRCEPLEGEARPRNVILEFDSYELARALARARVSCCCWKASSATTEGQPFHDHGQRAPRRNRLHPRRVPWEISSCASQGEPD